MNAKGITFLLSMLLFLCNGAALLAQKVSAEYINAVPSPKLEGAQPLQEGVQDLYYSDGKLFVINVWAGLQIIDVENPREPKVLGTYPTEHFAHNVFVQDSYAFTSNELEGVDILDISNPANINRIGTIETTGSAFWVVADYPYVFVAEEKEGLAVYDITNPENPIENARFKTNGWVWNLFLQKPYVFVGDKNKGLVILEMTNNDSLKKVSAFPRAKNMRSINVEDNIAYIANGPAGMWILDVSNPSRPQALSHISIDGYIYNVYRSGNSIFAANDQSQRIDIFNASDLSAPEREGRYESDQKIFDVVKQDVYLFAAADSGTVILRYNRPPIITTIENRIINEMDSLTIMADARDPDGDELFYTVRNLPEGARFDSLSGLIQWRPTYEQSGLYEDISMTVQENTASALTDQSTFSISVEHVNRPPVLADVPDDTVAENESISFSVPEGSDPDREDQGRLTYGAENMPEGAQFDPASRAFTWTPGFDQSGVHTVDFTLSDPAGEVVRDAANIHVLHVDRKPVLAAVQDQVINEDEELLLALEGEDPDREDQNALAYTMYNLPEGAQFDATTAILTWRPTYEQSGQYDSLMAVFTAGARSDSIRFNITVKHVNRAPNLATVNDQTVNENETLVFFIEGNDPDREDQGKLTYSAENLPPGAVFGPDSLKFEWKPTYEQSGRYDDLVFKVQDPSGLVDSDTITINVNHVNRSPVLAEIKPKIVNENTPLRFSLEASDPDREDSGKLSFSADALPEGASLNDSIFTWQPDYEQSGRYSPAFTVSDGRLEASQTARITVIHVNRPPVLEPVADQTVNENETLTFTVSGDDPDREDAGLWKINAENLPRGAKFDSVEYEFSWTPTFEQSGVYPITFVIHDTAGATDRQEIQIKVEHVNRSPEFAALPQQTLNENESLRFAVPPAADPDREDTGKLTYTAENLPDGATFLQDSLVLNWKPGYDQSGTYTVNITAADGEFSVEQPLVIKVNHVNRPPVMEPIPDQQTKENEVLTVQAYSSDPDKEDEGLLSLTAENLPEGAAFEADAGIFRWKPTYEQSGVYENITIAVRDSAGLSDQATFSVEVAHVNRPPELTIAESVNGKENEPLQLSLQALDPDSEDVGRLTYSAEGLPEGAQFDDQQKIFRWTPGFLQAGTYPITFRVVDTGELSDEKESVMTIADVNRPPQLDSIPDQTVLENDELLLNVRGSDPDSDNQLQFSASNLPEGAQFDPQTATMRWTPTYEQAGTYTVSFTLNDGITEVGASTTIEVQNVNRPPRFENLSDRTVKENEELAFAIETNDPDGDEPLTVEAVILPEGAVFNDGDNTLTWTPNYMQAGSYKAAFTVSDGQEKTEGSISITVQNVNRQPQIEGPAEQEVQAGETLEIMYSASDPDEQELKFRAENLPEGARVEASSGKLTWTPDSAQTGSHQFSISVSDGTAEAVVETTVVVKAAPQAETETVPADTSNGEQ